MRLPDELKARLDALTASTGRSAAYYVREALIEHLDELEYAYQLKAEAEAPRRGEMSGPTWEKLMEEVGLTEAELDRLPTELGQGDH